MAYNPRKLGLDARKHTKWAIQPENQETPCTGLGVALLSKSPGKRIDPIITIYG